MENKTGKELIDQLKLDPALFCKRGRDHDLLNEFFKGLPFEYLIPLLQSDDQDILKPAVSIVSELGRKACDLLPYIVPLVNNNDRFIRYYVLESIFLCASDNNLKEFIHIINGISDKDDGVRRLVMRLLARAENSQIEAGLGLVEKNKIPDYLLHQNGLTKLLNAKNLLESEVIVLLDSEEPLIQKYGAMIAKRVYKTNPALLSYALLSTNSDVKRFAQT